MDRCPLAGRMFLFEGLEREQTNAVLSDKRVYTRTFSAGEHVLGGGSFTPCLGLVLSGSVYIERRAEGKVVPMRVMRRGDVFGAASLFGGESHPTEIRAKGKTEIMFFPQEVVAELIDRSSRAARNYIAFLSEKVRYLNARIAFYTAGTAKDRLYEYLLRIVSGDGIARVPISLSALAGQLDLGRASLYRALDALENEGRIQKCTDGYLLKNISK